MPKGFLKSVIVLIILASTVPAQNFDIAIKKGSAKGDVHEITETDSHAGVNKFFEGGHLTREEKSSGKRILQYTVTILEGGDKRPARFKETFTKATLESGKQSAPLSFGGRTILYELKDGLYQVKPEGKTALNDGDLAFLFNRANKREEANQDALFLPTKGVKVGEHWTIDAKKIMDAMGKDLGAEFDDATAKVTGKLTKTYFKDENQWGTLEVVVKSSVKSSGLQKFDSPSGFNFTLILDTAIDGLSASGTMRVVSDITTKASLEQGGKKLTLDTQMDRTKDKTVVEKR